MSVLHVEPSFAAFGASFSVAIGAQDVALLKGLIELSGLTPEMVRHNFRNMFHNDIVGPGKELVKVSTEFWRKLGGSASFKIQTEDPKVSVGYKNDTPYVRIVVDGPEPSIEDCITKCTTVMYGLAYEKTDAFMQLSWDVVLAEAVVRAPDGFIRSKITHDLPADQHAAVKQAVKDVTVRVARLCSLFESAPLF